MWSVVAVAVVVVIIVIVVVARSHIHALVIEVCACLSVGLLYSICRITFYLSFTFLSLCLSSSQCVLLPLSLLLHRLFILSLNIYIVIVYRLSKYAKNVCHTTEQNPNPAIRLIF